MNYENYKRTTTTSQCFGNSSGNKNVSKYNSYKFKIKKLHAELPKNI